MPVMAHRPAPRERLLDAADHLFYEQGICSVGIDCVLDEAGVARASLYRAYGSKDGLVRSYLARRSANWQATVAELLPTRWATPAERIVGIFELLTEWFQAPGYNGCPFINASAEAAPSGAVAEVRDVHRAWVRELFAGLARDAGAADPDALSAQLVLLYDGSMVGAQLDASAAPGVSAQRAAQGLVELAIR
jgi:AcrR family transcriptional regulator